MLHFDKPVFGPIFSRRLGSSLGVNVLPSAGKLCNFDCIYCECGWNRDGRSSGIFPRTEDVRSALEAKLTECAAEGTRIDSITFSGNGEPTLNPDFPALVDAAVEARDRFFPSAKISVLSNATTVGRKEIFEALRKVDNPIMKIDAPTEEGVRILNRPCGNYSLEETLCALERFEGDFILQTMFLKCPEYDSSEEHGLGAWLDIVRRLRPRETMVYTIDRETPQKNLQKFSAEEMRMFTDVLVKEGFMVQVRG